jgi:hypothetical protein
MIFSKGNLMVGHVASKNVADVGLSCIRLNPDGSTAATNGKVVMAVGPVDASRIHFPDVGEQASPTGSGCSIALDLLEKVIKNLPKDKRTSLQNVAMTKGRDPRKVELTTTDMRHEQRIAGFPKQEPFPDWKAVLRRVRGSCGQKICVNRKDLIELLKALEEACPDRGGDNPVFIEIHPDGKGMALRCVNRETGQRAIGGITAYNTGDQWLPTDEWERKVFKVQVKRLIS